MKHWLGVLCVAAACAIAGIATRQPEDNTVTFGQTAADTANQVSTSLLTLAGILALIALIGLASNLTKQNQNRP